MKKELLFFTLMAISGLCFSQSTGNILFSGGIDLYKSDNQGLADKMQAGVEINYFLVRKYSVTGGAEFWTQGSESLVLGMRWYPINNFFLRFRGLIGANEVSLGAGLWKNLNKHWRTEGMADLYFQGDIAIRFGVAYLIR